MTTAESVEPTLTAARCHDLAWRAEEQAQMEERRLRTPQTILRATAAALRAHAAILEAVEAAPESPEALLSRVAAPHWPALLAAIRARDARHEAEKQALRADYEALYVDSEVARMVERNAALTNEKNAAQADADALLADNARLTESNDLLRAAANRHEAARVGAEVAPPTASEIDLAARALWTIGNARIGSREWAQVGHHYLFEAEAALLAARGLRWNSNPPAERVDGGMAAATGGEHG